MKYLALVLAVCLLLSGCASYKPPPGPLCILTEPQNADAPEEIDPEFNLDPDGSVDIDPQETPNAGEIDPEFSFDPGEIGSNKPETTPCGGEITLTYLPMGVCTAVSSRFSDYAAEQTLGMILTNASYDLECCDCMAEYTVILPQAGEYQLNLSGGYARYGGAQAALTAEQVAAITDLLTRLVSDGTLPESFLIQAHSS